MRPAVVVCQLEEVGLVVVELAPAQRTAEWTNAGAAARVVNAVLRGDVPLQPYIPRVL